MMIQYNRDIVSVYYIAEVFLICISKEHLEKFILSLSAMAIASGRGRR